MLKWGAPLYKGLTTQKCWGTLRAPGWRAPMGFSLSVYALFRAENEVYRGFLTILFAAKQTRKPEGDSTK